MTETVVGLTRKFYAPYHNYAEVQDIQPRGKDRNRQGQIIYVKTCFVCHQADGRGVAGQFPPLAGSAWVNEKDPERLIRIVLNGLQGPLELNGQTYNNVMVPWKDSLSDDEIADVLTYIRQNKDWGNHAPEVTPEHVRRIREELLKAQRTQPYTPKELLELGLSD